MKIILAFDSFKGSVSAIEACLFAKAGIVDVCPEAEIIEVPLADGGEGTVETLVNATKGILISAPVHDPLGRLIEAQYGILGDRETAVIEMSAAGGIMLLEPDEYNPMITSTYGVGELILSALDRGCRKFIIGLGGSATNDGGSGMLECLGFRFYDQKNQLLSGKGGSLKQIVRIDQTLADKRIHECRFDIACDVTNPFYGREGATKVFARQKGATPQILDELEDGMISFARIIAETREIDLNLVAGSGAAGGLGGAFVAFLNAKIHKGIELILDRINFESRITDADYIITGEGKMDIQTLYGKVPFGVLQKAHKAGVPVIGLCGTLEDSDSLNEAGFMAVFSILTECISLKEAMNKEYTGEAIQAVIRQIMRLLYKKRG